MSTDNTVEQKLSELQERNKKTLNKDLELQDGEELGAYIVTPEQINELTTDSFNAGALAVIGEILQEVKRLPAKAPIGEPEQEVIWKRDILKTLTNLEAKLKDV